MVSSSACALLNICRPSVSSVRSPQYWCALLVMRCTSLRKASMVRYFSLSTFQRSVDKSMGSSTRCEYPGNSSSLMGAARRFHVFLYKSLVTTSRRNILC